VNGHQRTTHSGIQPRTFSTLSDVPLHAHQLDTSKGVVYKGVVKVSEL
jgi:hypothetical protein